MSPEHAPTLLVVDDDPAFNRVLLRALGQRGFDTYGATDSEGALELAQDHTPEFIVLDLNIGGESGLKLIRPLLEASPGVRILVLTGYGAEESKRIDRTPGVHPAFIAADLREAAGWILNDLRSSNHEDIDRQAERDR